MTDRHSPSEAELTIRAAAIAEAAKSGPDDLQSLYARAMIIADRMRKEREALLAALGAVHGEYCDQARMNKSNLPIRQSPTGGA